MFEKIDGQSPLRLTVPGEDGKMLKWETRADLQPGLFLDAGTEQGVWISREDALAMAAAIQAQLNLV